MEIIYSDILFIREKTLSVVNKKNTMKKPNGISRKIDIAIFVVFYIREPHCFLHTI